MSLTLDEAVVLTTQAFEESTGYYSHTIPHGYSDFIDGMAWVGLLCGASRKVGNFTLADKCQRYLQTLIDVGKDARNYAPIQVSDDWKPSQSIAGYWYKEKPQSSAGPLALEFAMRNGATIQVPEYLQEKIEHGKNLTTWGFAFGLASRGVSSLRQHLNTMFMAYLASEKKPIWTMRWAYKENPFFSYIGGVKCSVKYPGNRKLMNVQKFKRWGVAEFEKTKPNSWVFRRDPFVEYTGEATGHQYTPIWMVVGEYLQSTL